MTAQSPNSGSSAAEAFVHRWSQSQLREQQGSQSHFIELCDLMGHASPAKFDTVGDTFVFEKHVEKSDGKPGRTDVWYKGHFAWEYKGKKKDLDSALQQVVSYKAALENPPLLVVCDFDEYRIYPQWTNMIAAPFVFRNEDLLQPQYRNYIQWLLTNPEEFIEERKRQQGNRSNITEKIAHDFGSLTEFLHKEREAGRINWTPMQVARFLTKLVFALFVEDIGLLPKLEGKPVFRYLLDGAHTNPEAFAPSLKELFEAMNGERNSFAMKRIAFFNGRLFADSYPGAKDGTEVLDLTTAALMTNILENAANADWRKVDPTIFGTLFESALDDSKRAQLGAHYTSERDIRLVVEPVLMAPLEREWAAIQAEAEPAMQLFVTHDTPPNQRQLARGKLVMLRAKFVKLLAEIRVLDPACGSGNFLYVSLKALKDLESHVHHYFAVLALPFEDVVTPIQLYGIEKDEFAAKLAHVVVWIGYLQWRYESAGALIPVQGEPKTANEIKEPIVNDSDEEGVSRILNDDAILRYDANGKPYEPEWPDADVIMGNPPFLGGKRMIAELGGRYVEDLRKFYDNRLPAFTDLVAFWFETARRQLELGKVKRVGLLATNSIGMGTNLNVLKRITQSGSIFWAWSDREWVLAGAAVRVAMIGFDKGNEPKYYLNGKLVSKINADLTAGVELTLAVKLIENINLGFLGVTKGGPFDLKETVAKKLLADNPKNIDVIKPRIGGQDVAGRARSGSWIIDFGTMTESDASAYEQPFEYVVQHVKPVRDINRDNFMRTNWWLHQRTRQAMRKATQHLKRYLVTPEVSKHRLFIWVEKEIVPDHQLIVFAREDDYFFGVMHSYLHECWSLRMGTSLEDRPRYTPTTTFETFPFPWTPGTKPIEDGCVVTISTAAKILNEERELWLNPPDLAGSALTKRTLTNLYNSVEKYRKSQRDGEPWLVGDTDSAAKFAPRLAELHAKLDAAVLAAYGWDDLVDRLRTEAGDEEMLRRLLALNGDRAAIGGGSQVAAVENEGGLEEG